MTGAQLTLSLIGSAFLLLGTGTTIAGALSTWRQYRPGELLLQPLWTRVERLKRRLGSIARRVFRRPPRTHTVYAEGIARTGTFGEGALVTKTYVGIEHEPTSAEFAKALEVRINETRE